MHPYAELRELIAAADTRRTGRVIAVDAQGITVATSAGTARAANTGGVALRAGDQVVVSGGVVEGRVRPGAAVPVYVV